MTDDLYNILSGMVDYDEEIRETYVRAPFGWPGGKNESAGKILKVLPYRNTFVEHCGGSGVVMLNRRSSLLDVFNDRDAGVTAFYRVIKDRTKLNQLTEWLSLTIHSREEFIWCRDTWKNCQDDVERAARWYYMVRMSFGQQRRNFGRAVKGRAQQPNMIYGSLPLFEDIHARFANVQVDNLDLFQSIKDYDSEDTVHYLDPNYYGVSPGIYENEITKADHRRLCQAIMEGKGFFALSGYPNEIYDSYNWDDRLEWDAKIWGKNSAFTETNHRIDERQGDFVRASVKECLWIRDNAD